MMSLVRVCTLLLAIYFTQAASECNVPPQYWCDSIDLAEQCGAVEACYKHWQQYQVSAPVKVELYYESLCPDCQDFINNQFYYTWRLLQNSGILSIEMIAYGNAHETQLSSGEWKYTCQHGPKECEGNLIENCIMDAAGYNDTLYMPVIFCMENSTDPVFYASKCVNAANMDWNSIKKCSAGSQGNALMHKAAVKTDALNPSHEYVPWIVVDGRHTEALQNAAQKDFLGVVCDFYKGTKPKECEKRLNNCLRV